MMSKRTALYAKHISEGAKIIPFAGWEMPVRYSGDSAEHNAVRTAAGLFDVSHMGQFLVRGNRALPLLQYMTTNNVAAVPVGKAQYNCLPNAKGGIVDDIIVYRLDDELYMVVVNAANVEKDWNWFNEINAKFGAGLENISEATSLLALSGPCAHDILRLLTTMDIDALPYYGLTRGAVAGIDNVVIATTGYTGEATFELFVRNAAVESLWDALREKGQAFGLIPAGLGARDTLRLEMGYMLYGNDIDDTTSPIAAGLGWIVKTDKGDFIDRDLYLKQKAEGTPEKLVAFRVADRAIPRDGYRLLKSGQEVGRVTSGGFSPFLKCGIGLAYVKSEYAAVGTELEIDVRGKASPVRVVKPPFVGSTSLQRWKK
jgi:aminomethyltransferase